MAAAALPLISAIIPGLGGIFGGINKRNAVKTAGTTLANAANRNVDLVNSTTRTNVDRVVNAGHDASGVLENETRAGQQGITDAGTAANTRYQQLLDQEKGNLDPYLTAGRTGADRYTDLMTNPQTALENTPGYQFQLQQGLKGVQNTAAGRGVLNSGGTAKALLGYGQGLAGTTYQDAIKNALAGGTLGLSATSQYNSGLENLGGAQAHIPMDVATKNAALGTDYATTAGGWNTKAAGDAADIDVNGTNTVTDWLAQGANATAQSQLGAADAGNMMIGAGGSALQGLLAQLIKRGKPTASAGNI